MIFFRQLRHVLWRTYEYFLWLSPAPRSTTSPVFVLFAARSGSKLLVSSLNHLDGVRFQFEVLNPHFLSPLLQRLFGDQALRFHSKRAAIRYLTKAITRGNADVYGAKIQFEQLHRVGLTERDLLEYFPKSKCIVLYRKSMSEQYVSLCIAEQMQCWGRAVHDSSYQAFTGTIVIQPDELRSFYDRLRAHYNTMRTLHDEYASRLLFVAYEDLRDTLQAQLRERICPFIEAEYAPVEPDFLQQKSYELPDVVEHFDELKDLLTGSQSEYVLI